MKTNVKIIKLNFYSIKFKTNNTALSIECCNLIQKQYKYKIIMYLKDAIIKTDAIAASIENNIAKCINQPETFYV